MGAGTETGNNAVAGTAEDELVIMRVFDAPRALVFKAWVDKAHALRWSGPRDYPAVHIEGDVRPGGNWRTCLRAADGGRDLWQGGVYREVAEPERLVFTFAWDQEDGSRGPETLVTIDFVEQGGKTKMIFRQAPFSTKANRDGHSRGWNSAFDRLAEALASA